MASVLRNVVLQRISFDSEGFCDHQKVFCRKSDDFYKIVQEKKSEEKECLDLKY